MAGSKTKHPISTVNGIEGKVCSKCNEWKPMGEYYLLHKKGREFLDSWCKQCRSKSSSEWNKNNPEQHKNNLRKWISENPKRYSEITLRSRKKRRERKNARQREVYASNPEPKRRKNATWRKANPSKMKEYRRSHDQRHPGIQAVYRQNYINGDPDHVKEVNIKWRRKNRDKIISYKHARRARMNSNGGTWTVGEWNWLFDLLSHSCVKCGRTEKELVSTGIKIEKDHIHPISTGGMNNIENLQPLCAECHDDKPKKGTIDYRPQWLIENFAKLKAEAGFGNSVLL